MQEGESVMANQAKLHEQIHWQSQGGRNYYQCKVCGKDFVSYPQGNDFSGWLGHKINQKYEEHVLARHADLKGTSNSK